MSFINGTLNIAKQAFNSMKEYCVRCYVNLCSNKKKKKKSLITTEFVN